MQGRMEQLEVALDRSVERLADDGAAAAPLSPSSEEGQHLERQAQDAVAALALRDERIAELEAQQSTNATRLASLEAPPAAREARCRISSETFSRPARTSP